MIIYSNRNKSFQLILKQVKFVMNDVFHIDKNWSKPMIEWQFWYLVGLSLTSIFFRFNLDILFFASDYFDSTALIE